MTTETPPGKTHHHHYYTAYRSGRGMWMLVLASGCIGYYYGSSSNKKPRAMDRVRAQVDEIKGHGKDRLNDLSDALGQPRRYPERAVPVELDQSTSPSHAPTEPGRVDRIRSRASELSDHLKHRVNELQDTMQKPRQRNERPAPPSDLDDRVPPPKYP